MNFCYHDIESNVKDFLFTVLVILSSTRIGSSLYYIGFLNPALMHAINLDVNFKTVCFFFVFALSLFLLICQFFFIATYKKANLSAAAKMHKFRNVRAPSKCKECDSYVYFNGAECEKV